jgi:F0F1-type ATP synthase membrane subunit a
MRQAALIGIVFSIVVAIASANAATGNWKVAKSGSSTGRFSGMSIKATVAHPIALGVRLIGNVSVGEATVSCSNGFGVRSWTHAGTFRLPTTSAADSCDVVASVGGSGRVTVQILVQLSGGGSA